MDKYRHEKFDLLPHVVGISANFVGWILGRYLLINDTGVEHLNGLSETILLK